MDNKKIFNQLKNFDPEIWQVMSDALTRQISTLSLIPTDSATSPFSSYLKGSAIGNDFVDYYSSDHHSRMETISACRACEIFQAEHAIVRLSTHSTASRMVLQAFAKSGDTILSFNLRKKEHCTGNQMQFNFVRFSPEPDDYKINFDKVRELAKSCRPVMIIYSPVNYPYNVDCSKFRNIADEVGAILWIDLGQNAGLIASKKIPSPVPFADVATFSASDALHGPQTGIILCKEKFADRINQKIIDTGHAFRKKNILAALAITLAEVNCEAYTDYSTQVLVNARALEKGIQSTGVDTICSPTQNHLVLVKLSPTINREQLAEKLAQANLLVKPEIFMTSDEKISYPVLRLSTLDPTTRSLKEKDLLKVGELIGNFLRSKQDDDEIKSIGKTIRKMVENQPLFSHEWLPDEEISQELDSELMMNSMIYWR